MPSKPVNASAPGIAMFFVAIAAGVLGGTALHLPALVPAGVLLGLYCLFAIKVVRQWEKVAVLRFGRYRGLREPGICWIVPIVDTLSAYVDQRIRVTSVSAESTLSRDTVPVNVDAIVFWMVWNAEKSILEVADFSTAVSMSA